MYKHERSPAPSVLVLLVTTSRYQGLDTKFFFINAVSTITRQSISISISISASTAIRANYTQHLC